MTGHRPWSTIAHKVDESLPAGTAVLEEDGEEVARIENVGAPAKSKKKKLPKIITREEAADALESAGRRKNGVRDRLMIDLMYRAGLRVSEVTALAPRDVQADGIIRLFDAKGGDGTAYFDPERIWPQVEEWLAIRDGLLEGRHGGSLPLFLKVTNRGKPNARALPISVRYIQRMVEDVRQDVGIRGKCTPHVFRHSYATELLEDGFTILEVQRSMRHAHLATTEIYLHLRDESLRGKMSQRTHREEVT